MPDDRNDGSDFPKVSGLMAGKRGLIMGVANDRSIAWGITQALHAAGAEMAFTYQGSAFGKRVLPMVEKLGSKVVVEADVEDEASLDRLFETLKKEWGRLDLLVNSAGLRAPTLASRLEERRRLWRDFVAGYGLEADLVELAGAGRP